MTEPVEARRLFGDLRWLHAALPPVAVLFAALAVMAVVGPEALLGEVGRAVMLSGLVLAAAAPFALLALCQGGRGGATALGIVGALLVINMVGLMLPRVGPLAELDWNWQGKTLDLIWCLALIALLSSAQRREIGWTFRTNQGTLLPAFINIGLMALVGFFALGGWAPAAAGQGLTLERILFDTTYPNLVEEIVFRGFMLAVLDRAFPPRWTVWNARVGWGLVLTSVLFGLVHGFAIGPQGVVFDPVWFAMSAAAGWMFGWIRALTGSLWPGFLAHCAPEAGILLAALR